MMEKGICFSSGESLMKFTPPPLQTHSQMLQFVVVVFFACV